MPIPGGAALSSSRYGAEPDLADAIRLPARPVLRDPEDRLMSFRASLAQGEALRRRGVDLLHIQRPFVAHYAGIRLARPGNMVDQVIAPLGGDAGVPHRLWGAAPIEVLPTGIPIQAFAHGERRRFRLKLGIPGDQPVALFVGEWSDQAMASRLALIDRRLIETRPPN